MGNRERESGRESERQSNADKTGIRELYLIEIAFQNPYIIVN